MTAYPVRRTTLTEADAPAFDRELAALAAAAAPDLTLDLSAVEFLSSMALTRFIRLDRDLRASGGRLSLVNVRPDVFQVFTVSRLDTLLDVRAAA
jgi:anti-sigma B factor antagonist